MIDNLLSGIFMNLEGIEDSVDFIDNDLPTQEASRLCVSLVWIESDSGKGNT